MKGWKTKVGAALVATAGVFVAIQPMLPTELVAYGEWFKFAEVLMGAVGAALMGYGIAHKIEKAGK